MRALCLAAALLTPALAAAQTVTAASGGGGLQPSNNLADVANPGQAAVNLGVLPISGGTVTGLLGTKYQAVNGTYNFPGAMSSGSIPMYGNIAVTGTPTNVPAFGFLSPLAFVVTNQSIAPSMNGIGVKAVAAAGAGGILQGGLFEALQNGTPAPSSYDNGYVGAQLAAVVNFNNGGSAPVGGNTANQNFQLTHGGAFGGNPQTICGVNATYMRLCNGEETDIAAAATSAPPAQKYGTTIIQTAGDAVRGTYDDAALAFGAQLGSSAPWLHGVQMGTVTAQFPLGTDGTFLTLQPQTILCPAGVCTTPTIAWFADATPVNYSGGVLKFKNGSIDGSGNIAAANLTVNAVAAASIATSGAVSGSTLAATGLPSAAYVGTDATGKLITASSPGSGVTSVDNQTGNAVTEHCDTFTASGSWTKLSWAGQITGELIGGGPGGGKGGTDPGSSITSGGGGGGGSWHVRFSGPASAFASGAVTIGAGGVGSTGGNATAGGTTSFAGIPAYAGGAGGDGASGGVAGAPGGGGGISASGGNASGATPGTSPGGGQAGLAGAINITIVPGQPTAGGPSLATGASSGSASTNDAPTGGAGGGGLTAAAAQVAGGNAAGANGAITGVAGGAAGGGAGTVGVVLRGLIGTGGAGGGSNASGVGGAGGAGVNGGGGGGGGAGTTGGGAGGNGGAGVALICQRATG